VSTQESFACVDDIQLAKQLIRDLEVCMKLGLHDVNQIEM
jgi:hypothetical protein